MVKMVTVYTFNSSTNISIHALQLHVCIANVHLNSLDNIYCTFEKLLYIIFTVTSSFNRYGPCIYILCLLQYYKGLSAILASQFVMLVTVLILFSVPELRNKLAYFNPSQPLQMGVIKYTEDDDLRNMIDNVQRKVNKSTMPKLG